MTLPISSNKVKDSFRSVPILLICSIFFVLFGTILLQSLFPDHFKYKESRYLVYHHTTGYRPISVMLDTENSPIKLAFFMVPLGSYYEPDASTSIEVRVAMQNMTIHKSMILFSNNEKDKTWPVNRADRIFKSGINYISVEKKGAYTIELATTGLENLAMREIYVSLISMPLEERVEKNRLAAKAISILLFVMGFLVYRAIAKKKFFAKRPTKATDGKPEYGRYAAEE